jgi:imidazolonepropionase-like amidohydrolase
MQDFDANLRDAINRGLTPGPRLFVATRIIASTGAVEGRTENRANGHCIPSTADAVDGVDECRKAVRRRIAAGADIIKFFADYRRRIMRYPPKQQHPYILNVLSPPKKPNPDYLVFSQEEMNMIVAEARLAGCPVAAHATTEQGALMAIEAGADAIEHALAGSDEMWSVMAKKKTILVPTLTAVENVYPDRTPEMLCRVKRAYDLGVRIACGGDTGTFPHGQNVREIELMVEAGIPLVDVLESSTIGGWEACGGDRCGRRFGWFEEGLQADMIALDENPEINMAALRKVSFVMKDAKVWKRDGNFVQMN